MEKRLNNKGYLLPMTVIYVVIAVILGAGILYLGQLEQINACKRLNMEKAFYIAEAGAWRAYTHLKEDIDWDWEGEGSGELGGGAFSVTVEEDEDDRINVISEGTVNGVKQKVQLVLASGGGNIWSQGLFGSERVTLENNVKIYGYDSSTDPYGDNPGSTARVGSIELVSLENNAKIYGGDTSVTSEGEITLVNNSKIFGNQNTESVFGEPFDDLPPVEIPSDLTALSFTPPLTTSGNSTYELPGGNYKFENICTKNNSLLRFTGELTRLYVTGTVDVKNNSKWEIQGTLVLYLGTSAKLLVENNSKIGIMQSGSIVPNLPADFRIYSASTRSDAVVLENNSDMCGLMYVPEGRVVIENNRTFMGGIVTDILDLSNNVKVLYDVSLGNAEIPDAPGGGSGELTFIRWTKGNNEDE